MRNNIIAFVATALVAAGCSTDKKPAEIATVKDHFKNDFLIGAAIPTSQINGEDPKADSVVSLHFNTIVAENCMKQEKIHPEEDVWLWDDADRFVKFGEENDMAIIGHCLVWHQQQAPWFFYDKDGNFVDKETLKKRMKNHITTLMTRYKGKIKGWDVVNEAIEDDGTYRNSPLYQILGEEFIPLAFEYAHEADPDVELYLNDYSMYYPAKREAYLKLIDQLKERGLRLDGIGMQSHVGVDDFPLDEYEKSIVAFGDKGIDVMVTELDISALPFVQEGADITASAEYADELNPYPDGLSEAASKRWNEQAAEVFEVYKRNADKISRITWWGVTDDMSWRNDWPIVGRTDYPLLFDRDYNLKPFMQKELSSSK